MGDYFVITEDDYYITPYITRLVDYYNMVFPTCIGYLALMADSTRFFPHHAAISNGLISRKTIDFLSDNVGDILQYFYNKSIVFQVAQINFSYLFLHNNIEIKDFRDTYKALCWSSSINNFEDYSNKDTTLSIFIPVQTIDDPVYE